MVWPIYSPIILTVGEVAYIILKNIKEVRSFASHLSLYFAVFSKLIIELTML